jgi:hypothetical protein
MWKKFVREPWCRAKSLHWPLALHFSAPARRDWTSAQRVAELARWSGIIADPDRVERLRRDIMTDLVLQLFDDNVRTVAELSDPLALRDQLERERRFHRAVLEHEQRAHRDAAAQRDALLRSTSWRLTQPLRMTIQGIRQLRRLRSGLDWVRRFKPRRDI